MGWNLITRLKLWVPCQDDRPTCTIFDPMPSENGTENHIIGCYLTDAALDMILFNDGWSGMWFHCGIPTGHDWIVGPQYPVYNYQRTMPLRINIHTCSNRPHTAKFATVNTIQWMSLQNILHAITKIELFISLTANLSPMPYSCISVSTSSVGLLAISPPSRNRPKARKYVGAAPLHLAALQTYCSGK